MLQLAIKQKDLYPDASRPPSQVSPAGGLN